MNAYDNNEQRTWQEQLAALERRLQGQAGDEAMLAEVGKAMRGLLSGNQESEEHIRELLRKQFEAGHLREESYELVQNLLGKLVTEKMVQSPLPTDSALADEIFAQTAVIEEQAKVQIAARVPPPAKKVIVRQPEVGSVLRDRFLLKERVAEGSMGVVYKALDKRLAETGEKDANVAIKLLSPQLSRNGTALRALQQEAAKGRCLTHPNIVRFIDLDRDDEIYFIVMEWIEGRSLSSILDSSSGDALDLPTTLNIVRQIGTALDYAHQRGVIHADVKPGNIIISTDGKVKLIDFGVARVRQKENEGKSHLEPSAMSAGTPAYSSMQVLTGEDPVAADDVFSLGCLMYRLVSGFRVFGPRNAAHAAQDGMEPQQPRALSNELWQPLKKALSYSRVTRYATPQAFIQALHVVGKKPSNVVNRPPPAPVEDIPDIRTEPLLPATPDPVPVAAAEPRVDREFGTPIWAENEPIMYEPDEDEPRRSPWRLAILGIILVVSSAAVVRNTDVIDQIGDTVQMIDVLPLVNATKNQAGILDAPVIDESAQDIAEYVADRGVTSAEVEQSRRLPESDSVANIQADDIAPAVAEETVSELPLASENTVNVPTLPPATLTVSISPTSGIPTVYDLIVREDSGAAIIDFVRADKQEALAILIYESALSGSQSSWEAGQYTLENNGNVTFAAGQDRARLTLSMHSDPVRESDRHLRLKISDVGDPQVELAAINLVLEDDDQRVFEEGLPANTVAFTVNQVSVREFDPAAQIDVIRFKPDDSALEVAYDVTDVTATEGQDYFLSGRTVVYFGPGQRTARILIPLGQDRRPEPDEAFMLQLRTESTPLNANLFSQVAVMIRDDD